MTLAGFAYTAAVVLAVLYVAVMVLLILIRVAKDRSERRRLTVRAPVGRVVLALSSGEGEELDDAYARQRTTRAGWWPRGEWCASPTAPGSIAGA